jgi:hypothetical protein
MSEQELQAKLGKTLQEFATAKELLGYTKDEINHVAKCLLALGDCLRIEANGQIQNPGKAAQIISELPENLTPAKLRELISEYETKASQVAALRETFKPYGV